MSKKNVSNLKSKEALINELVLSNLKNNKEFDVNLISDGEFTFGDYKTFLKEKGLYDIFKSSYNYPIKFDFDESKKEIVIKEIQEELPFTDEDYFKK